jgi:hypothetical protein
MRGIRLVEVGSFGGKKALFPAQIPLPQQVPIEKANELPQTGTTRSKL